MIHGNCVSLGCLAMRDKNIEEIYTLAHAALQNGQPFFRVHLFPFRMTAEKMDAVRTAYADTWFPCWENIKEGYDWFEKHGRPPDASVYRKSGTYKFSK